MTDDTSHYPDEYHHSGGLRVHPRRQRFDRAAALTEFIDATVDWTQTQISHFLGASTADQVEQAHLRMHRACAVLEWDEETTTALLRGVQG